MEEEKLIIDVETEEERRIDQFLADQMEYSRSFIQKLIKNERVTVNGNVITKVKYPVSFRDKIIIEIPAPTELEIKPEKMDLDILYEDNDVIVIDKPKGMVVHPSAGHMSHTLVNGLLYHCKGNLSGINGVLRPGIVHRIDMDTTGAIIACKTILPTSHWQNNCRFIQLRENMKLLYIIICRKKQAQSISQLADILFIEKDGGSSARER